MIAWNEGLSDNSRRFGVEDRGIARQISKRMSGRYWSLLVVLLLARTGLAERPVVEWMAGGHANSVNSVAISPDGQTLASGSGYENQPGEIKLWRVAEGALLRTLTQHTGSVNSVAFSPDSQTLA